MRSGGRVVEGARLESEYTAKPYRGFESLPLRHFPKSVNRRLGDDAQCSAFAGGCVADDAELLLEALELALLGFLLGFGVAPFDIGFLRRLFAQVGDADAAAEYFVAAKPQLRFRIFRQIVANVHQLPDEV